MDYYVYENLRASAMDGQGNNIHRYDDLDEAIDRFKELPDDWTTAIGCSIDRKEEIDLVHRVNGEAVKVMDFYGIDVFAKRKDLHEAMARLEDSLGLRYQRTFGIHPRKSVLSPIEPFGHIDKYMEDKILVIPKDSRSTHLLASINELYVEGKGWMEFMDFVKAYPNDSYTDPKAPVVTKVNATYLAYESDRIGQADMSPSSFVQLVKKTKEYNLSFEQDKRSIIQRIREIQKEQSLQNDLGKPEREMDR